MRWFVAVALLAFMTTLATAQSILYFGIFGRRPMTGVAVAPPPPPAGCGALQIDFSDTTGCNTVAMVLL